ncbi:MAG: DUF4340 domain-containing protein [Myxococcota bacterium]
MDRAQTRLLMVLSALVLAVGAVLYFQGERPAEGDPDATAKVWAVEADAVTAIDVTRAAGRVRLEKVDGTWFVREPFDGRADDDQVRDLIDAVAGIDVGIPVPADPSKSGEFGLGEPPTARVSVTLADGGTKTLDVGDAAPVGFRTYVRGADGAVVAVNGDANRPLQADPARFRDRRVFRFDPAEVREVKIVSADGTLRVHGEGHDWWLDGFARADADRVDDLVVGLLDLRFDTVIDEPPPIADPTYDVTIGFADGSTAQLRTGAPSPVDAGARALTGDGRGGTIFPEALAQLGRGPTDVGWRTAFGVRLDETDRVVFSDGTHTIDAHRNGPAWQADGFGDGDVYDAVSAISRVSITYQREPPPPPASVAYAVTVTTGDRTWTVEVGPSLGDGFRSARDTAGGSPFRVADDALAQAVHTVDAPTGDDPAEGARAIPSVAPNGAPGGPPIGVP